MTSADHVIEEYLKQLRAELKDLPRARRRELEQEISEHIAQARADLASESEAEIRTLLDRLGDPAEIAAEARERLGAQPRRARALDVATLVLLLVGGVLVPVLGWLVGVVLLWVSDAWSARDKLIGTLVVPGGLLLPLGLGLGAFGLGLGPFGASAETCVQTSTGLETCTGGTSILGVIAFVVLLLAPFATTAYLAGRMRGPSVPVTAAG